VPPGCVGQLSELGPLLDASTVAASQGTLRASDPPNCGTVGRDSFESPCASVLANGNTRLRAKHVFSFEPLPGNPWAESDRVAREQHMRHNYSSLVAAMIRRDEMMMEYELKFSDIGDAIEDLSWSWDPDGGWGEY